MTWELKCSWGEKHSRENFSSGWSGGLSYSADIFFLAVICRFQLRRDRCRAWQEKKCLTLVLSTQHTVVIIGLFLKCGPHSIEWHLEVRTSYSEIDRYLLSTFIRKKLIWYLVCLCKKQRVATMWRIIKEYMTDCKLQIMKQRKETF